MMLLMLSWLPKNLTDQRNRQAKCLPCVKGGGQNL